VVTISSPIEDNEEEDGCEEISTQDSSLRTRGGIPDEREMPSMFLADVLCVVLRCWEGVLWDEGGMLKRKVGS